ARRAIAERHAHRCGRGRTRIAPLHPTRRIATISVDGIAVVALAAAAKDGVPLVPARGVEAVGEKGLLVWRESSQEQRKYCRREGEARGRGPVVRDRRNVGGNGGYGNGEGRTVLGDVDQLGDRRVHFESPPSRQIDRMRGRDEQRANA